MLVSSLFHLNLSFSSIPRSEYRAVIDHCYWPLLNLAHDHGRTLPVGIELSGWTLERIAELDPDWIERLLPLYRDGKVDLISGGYNQIIAPLTPRAVNRANWLEGQRVFLALLGDTPRTLLVPEMCWSDGLPHDIQTAAFGHVVMEYHNAAANNGWPDAMRHEVPRFKGLNVIWADALLWQKVQRFVQWGSGDRMPDELAQGFIKDLQALPTYPRWGHAMLYGSDAEVFGYRPGQGKVAQGEREWQRLEWIWAQVGKIGRDDLDGVALSDVPTEAASFYGDRHDGDARDHGQPELACISTPEYPLPTKKQVRYNPLRWAVSGFAAEVNAACYAAMDRLGPLDEQAPEVRRLVLRVWGSDYRTHTCEDKQGEFRELIESLGRIKP